MKKNEIEYKLIDCKNPELVEYWKEYQEFILKTKLEIIKAFAVSKELLGERKAKEKLLEESNERK